MGIMEGGKIDMAIGGYGRQPTTKATPDGGRCADALEIDTGAVGEPTPISVEVSMSIRPPVLVHAPPARPRGGGFANGPIPAEQPKLHLLNGTKESRVARPPPKKKWIKEYFEEEPKSPVSVRVVTSLPAAAGLRANGLVRPVSPPTAPPTAAAPAPAPAATAIAVTVPTTSSAPLLQAVHLDFAEHSRPRTNSHHGPPSIPSPPSVSSNSSGNGNGNSSGSGSGGGNAPRAGTREVHNKLEKNRRAHLKECFELLKRQLPATPDDKKTSNLSILGSAIRYIQVLRRKERECEHELERLAREKIAAQQRLGSLKREISARSTASRPRSVGALEEKDREERINGQIVGIPISITTTAAAAVTSVGAGLRVEASASPPRTLNLSTKLRTLPIQITPSTSQVVRTTYGARHNTLTLTALTPADVDAAVPASVPATASAPLHQNGQPVENGVTTTLSTALVHPAQLHLPLSQVVGGGSVVVGSAALQLLSAPGALRVLQAPTLHTNGVATGENSRVPIENGIVSPPPSTEGGGGTSVVVNGLAPLMVSQPAAHLLQTHSLTHKMVETQMVKGAVTPLTVSAQYLSATTIVKPVVVVSGAPTGPAPPAST